jgi:ABC-2 type transport system ATP-binding protein
MPAAERHGPRRGQRLPRSAAKAGRGAAGTGFRPFLFGTRNLRIQSGYFGIRNNDDWIDEILANLDLTAKADTNMRRLSGGMKRRVLVAQALVHKPPVIVLDEPTAGVDVELRQGLWQFIRRLNQDGHTVILTTHYLEEAEALCGRIAMLKQGQVVALDTTRNLLARFSGQTLNLRLAGGPASLPPALRARATESDGNLDLPLAGLDELEPLLAGLRAAAASLTTCADATDLEDVFLGVMQSSSRQDAAPC